MTFIPMAEQNGLIGSIGDFVLEETCRQGRAWLDAGYPPIKLAANLSANQLRTDSILEHIDRVLKQTNFPAGLLEIEITESVLMQREDEAVPLMRRIRNRGIRISMDDFGTGYSSLSYLKRLPLDILKIDKSFVDDIPRDADDMEIAATIVSMGHILGMKVLA